MSNLPWAPQGDTSHVCVLLGRAASWGADPAPLGWRQSAARTDGNVHGHNQKKTQRNEHAVVSVLLIACSCPDYLACLKKILPNLLATHQLPHLLSVKDLTHHPPNALCLHF